MASTLTKVLLHVTFSTKNRMPLIPIELEREFYSYIGGICRNHGSALLTMNGVSDHVHALVSLGKTVFLADLLRDIKSDSSRWMKSRKAPDFTWQEGYFAFSIGESGVAGLRAYIAKQKTHHASVSLQDEVRGFLTKYRIEWDERYVWE